jgi:hypothetical protein
MYSSRSSPTNPSAMLTAWEISQQSTLALQGEDHRLKACIRCQLRNRIIIIR